MRIPVFLLAGVAAFAAAAQSFYTEPTANQVTCLIGAVKEAGGEQGAYTAAVSRTSKSLYGNARPTYSQVEALIRAVRESGSSAAVAANTNAAQIAEISGVVGTNSAKISDLEAGVATNASAIAALDGAMAGIVDESGSIPFDVIETPLAGETMSAVPTQNELAEAVKKIFTALGGAILNN